jgi:hypothetical protein
MTYMTIPILKLSTSRNHMTHMTIPILKLNTSRNHMTYMTIRNYLIKTN